MGFDQIAPRPPTFDLLLPIPVHNETPRAAGDFGDRMGAKVPDDLVERRADRRQGAKLFDHCIAKCDRLLAENGIALRIDHEFGALDIVAPLDHLHHADRKGGLEIVDHCFFAVAVYVERGSRRRRFPSVFHDFTPDNYGFLDLNKSKEPP